MTMAAPVGDRVTTVHACLWHMGGLRCSHLWGNYAAAGGGARRGSSDPILAQGVMERSTASFPLRVCLCLPPRVQQRDYPLTMGSPALTPFKKHLCCFPE